MLNFAVHTKETAPEKSVALLEGAEKAFGFVPNLIGTMAESPAATKGYLTIGQIFDETSFSPTERQLVILAASRYNECQSFWLLAATTSAIIVWQPILLWPRCRRCRTMS